jgi:hypothetical protein
MDRSSIDKVSKQVIKTFPEMKGVRPTVRRQALPKGDGERYLLTYKGAASLPGGKRLSRIVRVVADEQGNIVRISTSR